MKSILLFSLLGGLAFAAPATTSKETIKYQPFELWHDNTPGTASWVLSPTSQAPKGYQPIRIQIYENAVQGTSNIQTFTMSIQKEVIFQDQSPHLVFL